MLAKINYLEPAPVANGSRPERRPVDQASTIRGTGAAPHDVVVQDLSAGGCRFIAAPGFTVGSLVQVGLAGAGMSEARVAWRHDDRHGCTFLRPLSPRQLADAFGQEARVARLIPMVAWTDRGSQFNNLSEPDHALWSGPTRVMIHLTLVVASWVAVGLGAALAIR